MAIQHWLDEKTCVLVQVLPAGVRIAGMQYWQMTARLFAISIA